MPFLPGIVSTQAHHTGVASYINTKKTENIEKERYGCCIPRPRAAFFSITVAIEYEILSNILLAIAEKEDGKPDQWMRSAMMLITCCYIFLIALSSL